jgi:CBS domain-containing protein/CheY-like chemotaxis protein
MPDDVRRLPISIRRTVATGAIEVNRSVACPQTDEPISPEQCEHCSRLESVSLGSASFIACRPECDDGAPRDLAARFLPIAADRTPISAVMTHDVMCVRRDVRLEALMALFLDQRIGAVPVVDDDGFPVGMISKTDVVRDRYENLEGEASRVEDLMSPLVFSLRQDEPVSSAAALMLVEGVHHLAVVGNDGRVSGMISTFDFARWIAKHSGYNERAPRQKRILLVDGDPTARAALAELLADEGYQVRTAPTRAAAIRTLAEFPADVVVADLDLPGGDAVALEAAARRLGRGGIVWMAVRPGPAGSTQLVKPIDLRELLRTIERTAGA